MRGQRRGEAPIHSLLRTFAAEVQGTLVRASLYACVLAGFGLVGMELLARTQSADVAQFAAPEWIEVTKPIPAFALSVPEISAEPQYTIRRHASGGGRKDVLTFGDAAGQEATAIVEIYRPGAEAGQSAVSTTDVAELRLSLPVAQRLIESKFGPAAVEPFTDRGPHGDRRCLRVT